MVTQCNELRPTPFGSVAPQHRIPTSSRGIERECFKTWETFQGTLLKFYAQERGHNWNNGSITGTTSAGLRSTIGEGWQGTIVNVFTEPQWRQRGIAALLIKEIIIWSKYEQIARLVLHASDEGRSIYERLGFIASNEMRL